MAQLIVNPNRMELLRLKRRLQIAVRGHKLLKDKQESLMQEFMKIKREVQDQYRTVSERLVMVYRLFYQVYASSEHFGLEQARVNQPPVVEVSLTRKVGGLMPSFAVQFPVRQSIGGALLPLGVPQMLDTVAAVVPELVEVATIEKQLELLAAEIEKTRRRVNSLEYNLIPLLQDAIRGIVMKLEERDRAERTTLMKVKELLAKE